MERKRGATAESQGILQGAAIDRWHARRSRRNATQDGHASICSRICSQVAAPLCHPDTLRDWQTDRGIRPGVVRLGSERVWASLAEDLACFGFSEAASAARLISLRTLSRARWRRIRTVPGCSERTCATCSVCQFLHIVEHENDAQWWPGCARSPDAADGAARRRMLLFRACRRRPASSLPQFSHRPASVHPARACVPGRCAGLRRMRQHRFLVTV